MVQPLPLQSGRPGGAPMGRLGGVPQKTTSSQPTPKTNLPGLDRINKAGYLTELELAKELQKNLSYQGKTYSPRDMQNIAKDFIRETSGGSYFRGGLHLTGLRKKLGKSANYGPENPQKAENRRRLQMIQKIFGNQ